MEGDNQISDIAIADGPTGTIAIVKDSAGGSVMFQPRPTATAEK
jgi:hypothetical protein